MVAHAGFGLIGLFLMLVLVGVVVLIVLAAIRLLTGPGRPMPPPGYAMPPGGPPGPPPVTPRETPLDILARRFASGEITAEEFQKGRDLLQGGPGPAS